MIVSYLKNKNLHWYALIFFIVWMIFFDANSYLYQREYNQEISELQNSVNFYKSEIAKNKKIISQMNNRNMIHKYAREQYHYKRKNEDLYLIEFDTIPKD